MTADAHAIFRQVVSKASELPAWVRDAVEHAHGIEAKVLDQSYIQFLNDMIAREPRGPEWTQVLAKRRAALAPLCGKTLVGGFVTRGSRQYFIKIEPDSQAVLYWEENELGQSEQLKTVL